MDKSPGSVMASTRSSTSRFDAAAVGAMIRAIATAIAGEFPNEAMAEVAFLGIQLNGVPLARRLAEELRRQVGLVPPVGAIDINMYRDDVGRRRELARINPTEIPFDLEDRIVILVDDVLQTGRTIRAALDAITDYGRPRLIRVAVLVDRGGHELPIRADYSGRELAVPARAKVNVAWREIHGHDAVAILPATSASRRSRK